MITVKICKSNPITVSGYGVSFENPSGDLTVQSLFVTLEEKYKDGEPIHWYKAKVNVNGTTYSRTFDSEVLSGTYNVMRGVIISDGTRQEIDSVSVDTVIGTNEVGVTLYGKVYTEERKSGKVVKFTADALTEITSLIVTLEPSLIPYNVLNIYQNIHRYGVMWDGVENKMSRLYDAEDITTTTTNFRYGGVVNPNYDNPFDDIYPWSELEQVNFDLDAYRNGDALEDCIVAEYGDADFVDTGTDTLFVGRYRPEFWHTRTEDEDGNVIWIVADAEISGYKHAKAAVDGIGFAVDDGNGGVTCGKGQPLTNIAVNQIQRRAIASGFTLQDIYSVDAQIVLYLVEYADMNIQNALGNGCAYQYRQNASDIVSAVNGNVVTLPSACKSYCLEGATIDFGATNGAVVLANRRAVVSYTEVDSSTIDVTLDSAVDSTFVGLCASFHGMTNDDCIFGAKSGYLGTNGRNNVVYRGALLFGNRYAYTLGIYREKDTNHIWLCDEDTTQDYNALNTSVHTDTGVALPTVSSAQWMQVGSLSFLDGVSAFAPIKERGGNSTKPVGDQQYVPTPTTANTALLFGGDSTGAYCGVFCGGWLASSGFSYWGASALPLIKDNTA